VIGIIKHYPCIIHSIGRQYIKIRTLETGKQAVSYIQEIGGKARRKETKRPLGRPRRRWEDNIKLHLREIGWDGMDWIHVAEDMDQWRALVNTVMNLRVP
jgi:hypothetical protein